MAKRRAHNTLLHDSPSKRCSRYSVDLQLQSTLRAEGVSRSPPSVLALLGVRCRKRPHYFDNPDNDEETPTASGSVYHRTASSDTRKHVVNVLKVETPRSFEARSSSGTFTSHKKRHREDIVCPNTVITNANEEADADTNTEDCTYNSFQYWRVPLPELDLSLLEDDACDHSQAKYKDSCSEAMET